MKCKGKRDTAWHILRSIRFSITENWFPNHHPSKMDVLPKTFFQIIFAAKSAMQHSSTSPNQQQRPLPFLLWDSYSMVVVYNITVDFVQNTTTVIVSKTYIFHIYTADAIALLASLVYLTSEQKGGGKLFSDGQSWTDAIVFCVIASSRLRRLPDLVEQRKRGWDPAPATGWRQTSCVLNK